MAWSLVGVGSLPTPGTTLTLVEPAGVAAGDLLIACIASRSTALTAPTITGWTAVGSQNNNNILTTGSAIASGAMLYVVRGASAPTLAVTIPSGVSVVMGQIVAYRGNAAAAPLDVSTAVTMAAGTAVSVAGLTTTQADDLIVAMSAGGQEAAWSAFNATTPAGASGATDTTTAPSATWRERADNVTATGADTSLGIFDAVKTAAGATGNLTVTASISAGHVVIAGAFRMLPPSTADAWDINDKSANIALTNSDKTATNTNAGAVRSTTTHPHGTAGKYYAELVLDSVVTTVPAAGFQDDTAVITTTSTAIYVLPSSGNILLAGSIAGNLGAFVSTDVLGLAWDMGAKLVWLRKNGGLWNANASADPGTGTGGFSTAALASNNYSLWMNVNSATAGRAVTIRTELAEYAQAVPSGFTSWMGETPVSGGVTVAAVGVSAGSAVGTAAIDTVAGLSFEATGVAAGSAVGIVTVAGKANASPTGQIAGTALGDVSVAGKANVTGTGVSAAGAVGIASIATVQAVTVTPVGQTTAALTGGASVATSGGISVTPTSVGAAALTGTAAVTAGQVITVAASGHAAAVLTGAVSVAGKANVIASGVTTAALTGTADVATTRAATITPAGQTAAALTGGVSVAVGGGISITPTGVTATATTGTAAVSAIQQVAAAPAGQAAAALAGSVTVAGKATVSTTGQSVTAAVGAPAVATTRTAIVVATGVEAPALIGGVSVATGGSVSLVASGVAAAALAGTAAVVARQAINVTPAGVTASAQVRDPSIGGKANVSAIGQSAAATIGSVTVTVGVTTENRLGVWTGSAWAAKPVKVWNGSVWVQKPVKIWNGSAWL